MAKRLSEKQKEELVQSFSNGKTIDELCHEFGFSKVTIIRNLKRNLGEKIFKLTVDFFFRRFIIWVTKLVKNPLDSLAKMERATVF